MAVFIDESLGLPERLRNQPCGEVSCGPTKIWIPRNAYFVTNVLCWMSRDVNGRPIENKVHFPGGLSNAMKKFLEEKIESEQGFELKITPNE